MDFFRRYGAPADTSAAASKHSEDEIYPLHMLDDTKTLRGFVTTWTLRFDDVLDSDLLRNTLTRLLEIGDWRKLGGRLRLNASGFLELHVPRSFSSDRPAISYSCKTVDSGIHDDPLARRLPCATDGPSIQPGPDQFRDFGARSDAPVTLKDYYTSDLPVLSLHITSFRDATLVALLFPHVLMDVMGQPALLRSWSLVLAGKADQVPPLLGSRDDVLLATPEVSNDDIELMLKKQRRLTGFAFAAFGARFVWDMFWNQVVESKTIFLPVSAMSRLRRKAEADLDLDHGDGKRPFISDGDILNAWLAQSIALSMPKPRPITIISPMNARFRLRELAQSAGVYVQNMALAALTFLSPEEARGPVGKIALSNRRQLLDQSTPEHIHAVLQDLRSQPPGSRDPTMPYGEPNGLLVAVTNWTKAEIFNSVDFSPAVVESHQRSPQLVGKLMFHHSSSMQTSAAVRNFMVILGRDHEKNYWMTAMLLPQTWAKVEEAIAAL